jgi:phage N-6-adenine-methyltransferase
MNTELMFSSKSDMWETPWELFSPLNRQLEFETDVCAIAENAKCKNYYTPEMDGLIQEWKGMCWMNPPYGREIGKWVEKAFLSTYMMNSQTMVMCLLPARTDTKWFHDFCLHGTIAFIQGRLKFGGCKNSAPFPSMLVMFGQCYERSMHYKIGDKW